MEVQMVKPHLDFELYLGAVMVISLDVWREKMLDHQLVHNLACALETRLASEKWKLINLWKLEDIEFNWKNALTLPVGFLLGLDDGAIDTEGFADGETDGIADGCVETVGLADGELDGSKLGNTDIDGDALGCRLILGANESVGFIVGEAVGASLGKFAESL